MAHHVHRDDALAVGENAEQVSGDGGAPHARQDERAGTGGIDAAHGGIGDRGPGAKLFRESRDLGRHVLGIDSRAAGGGIEHSAPGSRRSALSFRGHAGTMIPG